MKVSRKHYHIPQFTGIKSNKVSLKKSNHDVRQGTENIIDNFRRNYITRLLLEQAQLQATLVIPRSFNQEESIQCVNQIRDVVSHSLFLSENLFNFLAYF